MVEHSEFPHLEVNPFRDAILFTAAQTEFPPALIEKDYYCSVILREIYNHDNHALVFKGGTSLNKIHAGFYRLSEDLDFSISISDSKARKERRQAIAPVKDFLNKIVKVIPSLLIVKPLVGSNESTQYNSEFEYSSCVSPGAGSIQLEIGLREEVIVKPIFASAKTLVLDPFRELALIEPFDVRTLNVQEAYAEKIRAALSRKTPAIRDLFDVDFAIRAKIVDFFDPSFQSLVIRKLAVPGNEIVDLGDGRKSKLVAQIETELRPVLRPKDFEKFDFNEAWEELAKIHKGDSI